MITFKNIFILCVISLLPVSAKEQVLSSTDFSFPNTIPGMKFKVEKVLDEETGKTNVKSNGKEVSMEDIDKMQVEEEMFLEKKHGAVKGNLRDEIEKMKDDDVVEISILLRPPRIEHLDKTKYSVEECKNHSIALTTMKPEKSVKKVIEDAGLRIDKIVSKFDTENDWSINCRMTKKDILKISFIPEIGAVSIYETTKPCLTYPAPLSSLSASAYNPSPLPSNATGQGVKAATFETGIWNGRWESVLSAYVYHFDARGNLDAGRVAIDNSDLVYGGHTQTVFSCLWYAAPSAVFHHQLGTYYGSDYTSTLAAYMVNKGIQTSSISYGNTNDADVGEMLLMDDFAYNWPYPVFCNPADNGGAGGSVNWGCYNAISVGSSQHQNQNHYAWATHSSCVNPPAKYGSVADREMPYVLAPGQWPYAVPLSDAPYIDPYDPTVPLGTAYEPALKRPWSIYSQGTSFAAPTANGVAACIISANPGAFGSWPEKVRVVMMLTAQNCDGSEWNCNIDGKDGTGTISGAEAVNYATGHTPVMPNNVAKVSGLCAMSMYYADAAKLFNILVKSKPSGRHLRIVLTWDSRPYLSASKNYLTDLDLLCKRGSTVLNYSASYNGNVEIINIPNSSLVTGETIKAEIRPIAWRFDPNETNKYFYYSIGWGWVKDNAQ